MAQPQSQAPPVPAQMPQSPHMSQMSQMAQRPQYPQQHSPSPAATPQPGFAMPSNKRPRTSTTSPPPTASQYSYPANSQMAVPSPSTVGSPSYPNLTIPNTAQQSFAAPYTNGNSAQSPAPTPALTLPDTRQSYPQTPATPAAPATPSQPQYTSATMAPIAPPPPPPTPGAMLPPSKPVERPVRESGLKDYEDALAGTGIDIRDEEQFLADYYSGTFLQEAKTGLPANPPGSRGSFYGAGFANQPGESVGDLSQETYEAEVAERAFDEAAHRLAVMRSNEIRDAFLIIPNLHHRAEMIAKEHGIGLNLEYRNSAATMGKMRTPQDFPPPTVTVSTKTGPDGALVATTGSFIPHDAYLVDQLALISVATKHRLRQLIEDADRLATHRQTTSHGEIPAEWADVAAPLKTGLDSLPVESESAANPNPLKRSFDSFSEDTSKPARGKPGLRNLMEAVRDTGRVERDVEEARLQKRQKRHNPESAAQGGSRAGSAAPGTPGAGAAAENDTTTTAATAAKAPSKKELKKGAAAARLAEASSTASANQTLNTLMGGFGKKRKKEYAWLQTPGSGTSTPRAGLSATDSAASGAAGGGSEKLPEKTTLTADPRYPRLGTWREDKEKGRNIQIRDWVAALEDDRLEVRALQETYMKLDSSAPK